MRSHQRPTVTAAEIVPVNATWSGSLFENKFLGIEPSLLMSISIDCQDMPAEKMASDETVSVSIDWIPFDGKNFNAIKGATFAGEVFGEPIEPSIYFDGIHHRFDKVTIEVLDQRGWTTDFRITISGDYDNLGLEEFGFTVTAEFLGVGYGIEEPGRLHEFTDTTGLVQGDGSTTFVPA